MKYVIHKEKIVNFGYIKIINFYSSNDTLKKLERHSINWVKIFIHNMTN